MKYLATILVVLFSCNGILGDLCNPLELTDDNFDLVEFKNSKIEK